MYNNYIMNQTELNTAINTHVEMITQGVNNFEKAVDGVYKYELSNGDDVKCIWTKNAQYLNIT